MAVQVDIANNALNVPDLGVTLRTIMACAATGYEETKKRQWKLLYKGVTIGEVRVKDTHLKGAANDNTRDGRTRTDRRTKAASTTHSAGVDSDAQSVGTRQAKSRRLSLSNRKATEPTSINGKLTCESDGEQRDAGVSEGDRGTA